MTTVQAAPRSARKPKTPVRTGPKQKLRKPLLVEVRLYADYEQSGSIAETDANFDKRLTFPGAILMSECLPLQAPLASFQSQMDGAKIQDANHLNTVTKLKLVHVRGLLASDTLTFSVSAADQKKIKLYDGHAPGAKAILGKGIARSAVVTALGTAEGASLELGIAAAAPPSAVKETVTVKIEITRSGKTILKDESLFTLAPWLMPPSTADILEAYVIQADAGTPPSDSASNPNDGNWANTSFRSALATGINGTGATLRVMVPGDDAGNKFRNGNRWMQDIFEFGVQCTPGRQQSIVINSANSEDRPGFPGVWDDLLALGHGIFRQRQFNSSSLDSFGNLEVTPPLAKFPLGCKYHGVVDPGVSPGHIDRAGNRLGIFKPVADFLAANAYQPVTHLATNWLAVGHVDEFLSIVPFQGKVDEFRVLVASPLKAIDILNSLKGAGLGANLICEGIPTGPVPGYDPDAFKISIDDFLADTDGLLTLNRAVNDRMDAIQNQLATDWGIPAEQFLPIPTLFNGSFQNSKIVDCIARTAGMVNGLVLGHTAKRMIMPKPFGPLNAAGLDAFEVAARLTLRDDCDIEAVFVDDWIPYHILMGEVHCGTNCRRVPPPYLNQWWDKALTIDGKSINA
jgi:protein-arginine deiminase